MFGSWIVAQFEHLNVRNPFLDFKFVTALLQTELAGCNNSYYTQNPINRKKGQLLYASIIEKTYPKLLFENTGKGYRPIDVMSLKGNIRIITPFFYKRIWRKWGKPILNNLSILSGIYENRDSFSINSAIFSQTVIQDTLKDFLNLESEEKRDQTIMALALSDYIKENISRL